MAAASASGAGAGGAEFFMADGGRRSPPETNMEAWETESIGTSASGRAESTATATTAREPKPFEAAQKARLVESIRGWIKLENELKELNRAVAERRKQKKSLTSNLVSVMKDHSIDCFDINNGSLVYTKNKVKMPVNKKLLMSCLMDVFKSNPEEAMKVTQYIMSSRQEKVVENIKMKLDV